MVPLVRKACLAFGTATALCFSTFAVADNVADGTFFGEEATGKWMIGLKASTVQNSETAFGDASTAGVLLGYLFSRPIGLDGSASIEFELSDDYDEGSIGVGSDIGGPGKWSIDSVAAFFAYRTPGQVYFKGKLGGMQADVTSAVGTSVTSKDNALFAYGAGLGVQINEWIKVELEYVGTRGDSELDALSLGGIVEF